MKESFNTKLRELYTNYSRDSNADERIIYALKVLAGDVVGEEYWILKNRFSKVSQYLKELGDSELNNKDTEVLGSTLRLISENEKWKEKIDRKQEVSDELGKVVYELSIKSNSNDYNWAYDIIPEECVLNEQLAVEVEKLDTRLRRITGKLKKIGVASTIAACALGMGYNADLIGKIASSTADIGVSIADHATGGSNLAYADEGSVNKADFDLMTRDGRQAYRKAINLEKKVSKDLDVKIITEKQEKKGFFKRLFSRTEKVEEPKAPNNSVEQYVQEELNGSYVQGDNSFNRALEHVKNIGKDTFGNGGSVKDINGNVVKEARGSYKKTLDGMKEGWKTVFSGKREDKEVNLFERLSGLYRGTVGGVIRVAGNTTQAAEDLVDAGSEATLGTVSRLPIVGKLFDVTNKTVQVVASTAQSAGLGDGWHRVHKARFKEGWKGLPIIYNLFYAPKEEGVDGKVFVTNNRFRRFLETFSALGFDYWGLSGNSFGGGADGGNGIFGSNGGSSGGGSGININIGDLSLKTDNKSPDKITRVEDFLTSYY